MASKSKRARMAPQRNYAKTFLYWAITVFVIKLIIIFSIPAGNIDIFAKPFSLKGGWLGADGENYITSYKFLVNEGIFSQAFILNFWPAGYPLFMLLVSLFGKSWIFVNISIIQSFIFSISAFYFAKQIYRTRVKGYAFFILLLILLNPTLSLSSVAVGYESMCSSGILISTALIIKDFIEKKDDNFFMFLSFSSCVSTGTG
jgi:hypothetical protein